MSDFGSEIDPQTRPTRSPPEIFSSRSSNGGQEDDSNNVATLQSPLLYTRQRHRQSGLAGVGTVRGHSTLDGVGSCRRVKKVEGEDESDGADEQDVEDDNDEDYEDGTDTEGESEHHMTDDSRCQKRQRSSTFSSTHTQSLLKRRSNRHQQHDLLPPPVVSDSPVSSFAPSSDAAERSPMAPGSTDAESTRLAIRGFLEIQHVESVPHYFLLFQPSQPAGPLGVQKISRSSSLSRAVGQRRERYTTKEDKLLVQLKKMEELPWDEIGKHFPTRKVGSLQVHYSTKLRERKPVATKRRRRDIG